MPNFMMHRRRSTTAFVAVRFEPRMTGPPPIEKPSVLPRPTLTTGKPRWAAMARMRLRELDAALP